jgi:hypothetical protein
LLQEKEQEKKSGSPLFFYGKAIDRLSAKRECFSQVSVTLVNAGNSLVFGA